MSAYESLIVNLKIHMQCIKNKKTALKKIKINNQC